MNTKVFFDEAGNSGDNLLDKDQPVYVLASHNFNEDETRLILAPLLSLKNGEIHFYKLCKSSKNYKKIIDALNNELLDCSRIVMTTIDKRFALWCNIVDKLVEPFYAEVLNEDMNKGGRKLQLANILYWMQNKIEDKELIEDFLQSFQNYYREKDLKKQEDYKNDFLVALGRIEMIEDEDVREFFGYISMCNAFDLWDRPGQKYSLDFSISEFNYSCNRWGEILQEKFNVYHDNSKQIEHWKEYIKFMADERIPETVVGYGDRKHVYPLKIDRLELVDSKESIEIQLADLFASSLSYYLRKMYNGINEPFLKELAETRFFKLKCFMQIGTGLNLDSEKFAKEMQDVGVDGVDFIVEQEQKYLRK
jgi:hypothetical protein